jgi:CysZ protein
VKPFFSEFLLGIQSYGKALKFIRQHRLYWYFFLPAILMLFIYSIGNQLMNYQINADLSNMNGIVWYFIYSALNISIALLLMKFAKYIVVVTLSPLLSFLSQKSERLLSGATYQANWKQIMNDVRRGIRLAIRNILWEYFFFLVILIIATIGWGNPTESPLFYLTIAIGFYYYGFSFLDYYNERKKLDERRSIAFVRKHRGLAVGIGTVYSLLILVPVDLTILFSISQPYQLTWNDYGTIGMHFALWILASIAPILAIVSATLAMEKTKELYPEDFFIENLQVSEE